MDNFRKLVLALGLLGAGYVSYRAMTSPGDLLDAFDVLALTADGRSAIRGQYGGFYAVVAIALFLSLVNFLRIRTGLLVLLITVGGILLGRLSSLVIEGTNIWDSYSSEVQTVIMVEAALTVMTLAALIGARRGA